MIWIISWIIAGSLVAAAVIYEDRKTVTRAEAAGGAIGCLILWPLVLCWSIHEWWESVHITIKCKICERFKRWWKQPLLKTSRE